MKTQTLAFFGVAAFAAAACSHSASGPTGPTNTAPPPRADFTGDDAALIPSTMQLVASLDWPRVHSSALFGQFVQPKLDAEPQLTMVKSTCGFDPFATVTSVTLAVADLDRGKSDAEVIVRGLPRDQWLACLPKLVTQAPAGSKVVQDKDTWTFSKDNDTVAMRFINASTALLVLGQHASQVGTDALLDGGASAMPSSQAYVAMQAKLTGHAAWFVANMAGHPTSDMPGLSAVFGSADVSDGLAADITLRFASPDAAQSQAQQLKAASAQLQMFVTKLDIAANDKDVGVQAAIDHDKLVQLLQLMMGGGGGPGPGPMTPPGK
jgi:hypothetical protein